MSGPLVDEVDADAGDQGGAVLEAHDGQVQTAGTRGEGGGTSAVVLRESEPKHRSTLAHRPDTSALKVVVHCTRLTAELSMGPIGFAVIRRLKAVARKGIDQLAASGHLYALTQC